VPTRPLPLFKGPTSKGMEGNGRGEGKVKGKEGEREGFGPPKNFDVAPPMRRQQKANSIIWLKKHSVQNDRPINSLSCECVTKLNGKMHTTL